MRVREAREVDVPAIEALVRAAFAPFTARTGIRPAPLATDWPTVVSARGAQVAVVGERVVGVLVAWPHPDHLLVELVAVASEAQGAGVGRALLEVAADDARRAGLPALRLFTNALMRENLAWYPRVGFTETGRRHEQGFDRVFFERALA